MAESSTDRNDYEHAGLAFVAAATSALSQKPSSDPLGPTGDIHRSDRHNSISGVESN